MSIFAIWALCLHYVRLIVYEQFNFVKICWAHRILCNTELNIMCEWEYCTSLSSGVLLYSHRHQHHNDCIKLLPNIYILLNTLHTVPILCINRHNYFVFLLCWHYVNVMLNCIIEILKMHTLKRLQWSKMSKYMSFCLLPIKTF